MIFTQTRNIEKSFHHDPEFPVIVRNELREVMGLFSLGSRQGLPKCKWIPYQQTVEAVFVEY